MTEFSLIHISLKSFFFDLNEDSYLKHFLWLPKMSFKKYYTEIYWLINCPESYDLFEWKALLSKHFSIAKDWSEFTEIISRSSINKKYMYE